MLKLAPHFFYLKMKGKKLFAEILIKLERYCKYQERCKSDIENKLNTLGVTEKIRTLIIHELSEKNYFDNKRFSYEYAIGKFRNNNWGRIKIRYNLKSKFIEKSIIDEAIKKIPEAEYLLTFNKIADKVWLSTSKLNLTSSKRRFYKNLQSRGWEYELINDFILKIKNNKL